MPGVKDYTCRNWEEIKGSFALGLAGWPMLLYSTITRKPISASGDAELGLLYGPLLLGFGVKELLIPSQKAKRITNTEALSTERTEDSAAVFLNYNDDPNKFSSLDFMFPNGIELHNRGAYRPNNQEYCLEKYNGAKHFLPVEKSFKENLYASVEQEERREEEWIQFGRRLREADQTAFLQKIGFITKEINN